jgi:CubicO group peptidase (beta-lactamase class C family)
MQVAVKGELLNLPELHGPLTGHADPRLAEIVAELDRQLTTDPGLSFQVAAFARGRLILDAWGGPHLRGDSLIVPFSVSKNTIGVAIGLLVERGQLDLDATVASYWPEFAQAGKAAVTVRQLLSHQAGLPAASPRLSWDELLDHHRAAERLAATRPLWHPGSAFGYHAVTIGNLASELVFRVTGSTLHEFYEREVRKPLGADFYLGLPKELDHRLVPVLPLIPPLGEVPRLSGATTRSWIFGPRPGPQRDLGNDEQSWRFGHPAGSATGSARGIATVLAAAVTGVEGRPAFLGEDTVATIGQQQVRGYDEVLGQHDRAHGVVFQKPSEQLAWGSPYSFGHDGAYGAVACVDPATGVAFAYTVARGPWPGGGDPRAIRIAREIGEIRW